MSNNTPTDTAFDWTPLGELRARELGEAAGCSELQLRFGMARFRGASQTAAAREAGYEGTGDALRRAGYAACRTTGVQNFLELAAIDMPDGVAITDREIDAKVAKLIRSSDSNVSLKAMEVHSKREATKAAAVEEEAGSPEDDARAVLGSALGGLLGVAAMQLGIVTEYGPRLSFKAMPLFKELAPNIKTEFPEVWWRILNKLDSECRVEAEQFALAAPANLAGLATKTEPENAA